MYRFLWSTFQHRHLRRRTNKNISSTPNYSRVLAGGCMRHTVAGGRIVQATITWCMEKPLTYVGSIALVVQVQSNTHIEYHVHSIYSMWPSGHQTWRPCGNNCLHERIELAAVWQEIGRCMPPIFCNHIILANSFFATRDVPFSSINEGIGTRQFGLMTGGRKTI